MSFFNSGLFWFLEGVIACLVVISVKIRMEERGIPMPWWKWLLFGFWALFFGFTLAFVGTSLGENEPTAAGLGGIIFGLSSIISGIGLWRILMTGRENKKS